LAHRFEPILDAAAVLQDRLPKAVFVFVGDGPRLAWVRGEVTRRQLANIRFLPSQPREDLAGSLGGADVHLASMREDLLGLVVPSKVYGILAAGRPCVFLGPAASEVACVIAEQGCGSVLPHAGGQDLAENLTDWYFDLNRLEQAGKRAAAASLAFTVSCAAPQFESLLKRMNASPSPRPGSRCPKGLATQRLDGKGG
jgi:glycosyltransferase involved in cell wall biosynthesis